MSISDVASLVGGAALGAPLSEILNLVIGEAKKVKDFKSLSEDLASTMERLVPVFKEIDLIQERVDPGKGEVKSLIKTMQRAEEMVRKCSSIQWYSIAKKAYYTRKIKAINQDFLRFCQIELQLIQHKNLLHAMHSMATVTGKIDLLSDTGKEFSELFMVPQPEEVMVSWLERPLKELKKKLFEDGVVAILVSASSACGKTTLVTKLCHDDADVKGRFKHIFFIAGSKRTNATLVLQRLFQLTGCKANEFEKDLDARICIQQLLKQLGQRGPLLLVLDDVRPGEESFLEKFLIPFPDYKVLVTSRFEFPRFGASYHLERVIDEDFKNLFIDCVPQHNCLSCAKRDELLMKILKCRNGLPLAMNLSPSIPSPNGESVLDDYEDEQLAKAVEKSVMEKGKGRQTKDEKLSEMNPPHSICGGCKFEIEQGKSVDISGVLWHLECLWCDACHEAIAIHQVINHVSNTRGMYHNSCYERYCYVCKENKMRKYHEHHFWKERYCPSHESDGTPKCYSCERLEPRGMNYSMLVDRRWLCRECMESAIMDASECQPLHSKIREFFKALNMKVEQRFPLLLVEKQALNKARKEEKIEYHHEGEIRGCCLSKERIISVVLKGSERGSNKDLIDMKTESCMLARQCEVTAILVIYGLPRVLTGSILAHEMVHAWLRLNGYNDLNPELENGLCQVIAHMWLESQSCTFTASSSKATILSDFEKKLLQLYKMQMEVDYSPYYAGFMKVKEMVSNSGLEETLKSIRIQNV